jgi:hypothetical protein
MKHAVLPLAALALCACGSRPAGPAAVPAGAGLVRCVNPASKAAWTIRIDEPRARADGWPARINAGRIAWANAADGGAYELKRGSGELSVTRPSSTGGYIMLYNCRSASVGGR